MSTLTAISPLDGRYFQKTKAFSKIFSEYGLIYYRTFVEVRFLQQLCDNSTIKECPVLSDEENQFLESILLNFDETQAQRVKDIEKTTNHDVKAIEYYLKETISQNDGLNKASEFIHFGLTSEDINNLAYALMIKEATTVILSPKLNDITDSLGHLAKNNIDLPMMSRTHGQAASPTTLGKELANVIARLQRVKQTITAQEFLAKCNGAVGNYNALAFAYPDVDWQAFSRTFIEDTLKLKLNPYTTQIEPHDWIAELCHKVESVNTILIDFCRDAWSYISIGYFKQKVVQNEVGSSTMPHKVNPIDFENAEGNLGIANALLSFFAAKLPISRYQRDLTDSTVLRNLGVAFSHSLLAYESLLKGLTKLDVNQAQIQSELDSQWALLAEPIQTVMRRYGIEKPYEQLKALTRGQEIDQTSLHTFIETLNIPANEKARLKTLTPSTYLGLASKMAREIN